jgi:hypothetical protein
LYVEVAQKDAFSAPLLRLPRRVKVDDAVGIVQRALSVAVLVIAHPHTALEDDVERRPAGFKEFKLVIVVSGKVAVRKKRSPF